MRRRSLSHRGSKRLFTATASRSPALNFRAGPMRGGIRL